MLYWNNIIGPEFGTEYFKISMCEHLVLSRNTGSFRSSNKSEFFNLSGPKIMFYVILLTIYRHKNK